VVTALACTKQNLPPKPVPEVVDRRGDGDSAWAGGAPVEIPPPFAPRVGPDPSDTALARRRVTGAIRACVRVERTSVRLIVEYANTGLVTAAHVENVPWKDARACVAREVRRATVPPFLGPAVAVTYQIPYED